MTQQTKHINTSSAIDDVLRAVDSEFGAAVLTPQGDKYEPWYATFLSSAALVASGEEVIYAHANFDSASAVARIVVFSTNLVIVSNINTTSGELPRVQAVRRGSLNRMDLSSSGRIDATERRSREWPGMLSVALTYEDLDGAIEIAAYGADPFSRDKLAPIVVLIEELRTDLTNARRD